MDKAVKISKERFQELYRKLITIRRFEEKVDEFFRQGKVIGAVLAAIRLPLC